MITQPNLHAIILAAGASTRFNTGTTKLIAPICGQELILYPLKAVGLLNLPITLVLGNDQEKIEPLLTKIPQHAITIVTQSTARGTGDALCISQKTWNAENLLVINGDMPLITSEMLQKLFDVHQAGNHIITFATAHLPERSGYGRVVQQENKIEIVEQRDFNGDYSINCLINAGIYIFKTAFVKDAISKLKIHENSNEFYITDLIKIASDQYMSIGTVELPFELIQGVNTVKELWACEQIKRNELIAHWMDQGVYFPMADTVRLDIDIEIGKGSVIETGATLLKGTKLGTKCHIKDHSRIENCIIEDNVIINPHSVLENSHILKGAIVGPFAHIHQQSTIEEHVTIGNFVEIVRSNIGVSSKAKHLTYIGDTTVGTHTNIGAGTVVCNYNGFSKQQTTIGSECFIGSNTTIIAPVSISDRAIIAAGSTITQDVPCDTLAIARTKQENKLDYAPKLRAKFKEHTIKKGLLKESKIS